MVSLPSPHAYDAARRGAAYCERLDRGYLVVSGADRAAFLHALLTNDIAGLREGTGCYAAFLTAQGRMITDLWVHELGDAMLLRLSVDTRSMFLAKLDALVFSEDVQLGDVTDVFRGVTVVGPAAPAVLNEVLGGSTSLEGLAENGCHRLTVGGGTAIIARTDDLGIAGYELLIDLAHAPALMAGLEAHGAVALDHATAEVLRIEQGMPRFHQDMDDETIPLEAGIENRAISLTKGCYVGQEVIVRVLHRGHGRVARRLVGLVCEGQRAPRPGDPITAGGKAVGSVTSSAVSPAAGHPIALAYLQRDHAEPGHSVDIGDPAVANGDDASGASPIRAVVVHPPFVPAGS